MASNFCNIGTRDEGLNLLQKQNKLDHVPCLEYMWCFARFGIISTIQKTWKKYGGVLLLVQLQASTCNVTSSITPNGILPPPPSQEEFYCGGGGVWRQFLLGRWGKSLPQWPKNLLILPPPGKVPPVEPLPLAKNLIIPPAPGKVPPRLTPLIFIPPAEGSSSPLNNNFHVITQ